MKGLPEAEIYELELEYWPYKASWNMVLEYLVANTPQNSTLLDLMCGTGYLLNKIADRRPDLKLKGVDIKKEYISYAKQKYPNIDFSRGDVLFWKDEKKYEVVICTGALHHIIYEKQHLAVKQMASLVKSSGFVLISDCYIDEYANELERKLAAAKLGYEYLIASIKNQAPKKALQPCCEIMENDVLKKEFKTSLPKRLSILKQVFRQIKTLKAWPDFTSEYGDYIHICHR